MRKKIVAGNWKMNMDLAEGLKFAESIESYFNLKPSKAEVILCTPFIHLAGVSEIVKNGKVYLGAQNCSSEASGAYTGEVSAQMIKSTGADYVIIGHSERRTYYHEDDRLLNKKTSLAIKTGLKVIFCCGEVLQERESGKYLEVVKRQLEDGLFNLSAEDFRKVVIAYEPVWAIGTLRAELGEPGRPVVRWEEPDAAAYRRAFDDVMRRIASGSLIKAVPFVLEAGRSDTDPAGAMPALVAAALAAPGPSFAYGVWTADGGMVGASPEILFTRAGDRVQTVAIAGTDPAERANDIHDDPKECREHQTVVDDITGALAPFGAVTVGAREILRLPGLVHLKTDIRVTTAGSTPHTNAMRSISATPRTRMIQDLLGERSSAESILRARALSIQKALQGSLGAPLPCKWLNILAGDLSQ